jgi:hypothetical protein
MNTEHSRSPHPAQVLPAQPNLQHLKNEAKQRLKALRSQDPGAKLAEAQLAVARDYGFTSWRMLWTSPTNAMPLSKPRVVVTSLEPTIPRSDAKVVAIRCAAATARDAITKSSSEAALDATRAGTAKVLYELCVLIDRNIVTRDAIVRAQRAVATWLNALGVQRG